LKRVLEGFDAVIYNSGSNGRCATNRYFQALGSIHDIEAYSSINNNISTYSKILTCHFGHAAVVFSWLTASAFHIGWSGTYISWIKNPITRLQVAHGITDPHFGSYINESLSPSDSAYSSVISYSGIYNWLYAVGMRSSSDIFNLTVLCEVLCIIMLVMAHMNVNYNNFVINYKSDKRTYNQLLMVVNRIMNEKFVNNNTVMLVGYSSILWGLHLMLLNKGIMNLEALQHIIKGDIISLVNEGLTFIGGLESDTAALYGSDIAHHHIAVGVIVIWFQAVASSIYRFPRKRLSYKSYHYQLAIGLSVLGLITAAVGSSMSILSPYPFLAYDYVTVCTLEMHHSSIAATLMIGSFSHAGIFLIRDLNMVGIKKDNFICRILSHKSAIISHLTWVTSWLGFHILGVYVHNDNLVAFGNANRSIIVEPVFAQVIQQLSGKALYGTTINNGDNLNYMNKYLGSLISPALQGDLLASHAIAFGLHVTALILIKGALDGRRSKLMGDKISFNYHFACDGPARGGTCDISAWDSVYLATFWGLNSGAWTFFYFHWKHLTVWQNAAFQFDEGSTYLNAWFRDYLWFNSSALISGYDSLGVNDLSIWAWVFLAAHLCWATGFMFLISWRGYWQELIDIMLYMHLRTPILYDLFSAGVYTPVALSIIQARFIGLIHFSVGLILTYIAFVIGSTS